jgi:hypothetical protein
MAGHMPPPLDPERAHAPAYTPTDDLLGLPILGPEAVPNSGAAYAIFKQANHLRVQAAAVTWGDRGAQINCIRPGIILTPLARDEMSGPGAEGYRKMIEVSAGSAPPTRWPTRPPSSSARTPASSPAPTCSSAAVSSRPCGPDAGSCRCDLDRCPAPASCCGYRRVLQQGGSLDWLIDQLARSSVTRVGGFLVVSAGDVGLPGRAGGRRGHHRADRHGKDAGAHRRIWPGAAR